MKCLVKRITRIIVFRLKYSFIVSLKRNRSFDRKHRTANILSFYLDMFDNVWSALVLTNFFNAHIF